MQRPPLTALCLACLFASAPAGAASDVVERRGGAGAMRGEIVRIDDAGVTILSDQGTSHPIPWDRVRDVQMARHDPALSAHLSRAEDLWRARARLERGDAALAEELFERLFEYYRGQTHETALIVAEGLLRCRLARFEHELAMIPGLEVIRLRRAQVTTDRYRELRPLIDVETSLIPELPPVWSQRRLMQRLDAELSRYDARGDEVVAAIAEFYQFALRRQLEPESREALPRTQPRHPGPLLLRDLLQTQESDAERRRDGRTRLSRRMENLPEWSEAWARFFLGASLLAEPGDGRQKRGAVSLAYLPARFGHIQPYLAGAALARLIEHRESLGDAEGAASLREELARRYPGHPQHIAAGPATTSRASRAQRTE